MGKETAGGGEAAWVAATGEAQEAVAAALRRRDLAPRVRERLELVKGVGLGQSLAEVVRWSGRTERTVTRGLGAFVDGGVATLADARRWPMRDAGRCVTLADAPRWPMRHVAGAQHGRTGSTWRCWRGRGTRHRGTWGCCSPRGRATG
jgi:hypothetical protein